METYTNRVNRSFDSQNPLQLNRPLFRKPRTASGHTFSALFLKQQLPEQRISGLGGAAKIRDTIIYQAV